MFITIAELELKEGVKSSRRGINNKNTQNNKKKRGLRLVCEGPAEPSDTSSGHSSDTTAMTTTTTTTKLELKVMDTVRVDSHKDTG